MPSFIRKNWHQDLNLEFPEHILPLNQKVDQVGAEIQKVDNELHVCALQHGE